MKSLRRHASVIAAAAALLLTVPAPAHAAVAAAAPGGFVAGFATPVVVAAPGEAITFANADVAPHNFVADGVYLAKKDAKKARWCSAYTLKNCPLFWSPTIAAGETADVEGTDYLEAGKQYPFFCSVHPGMKGTLVVR
ncbi:MAG TPA: plastocyanin/azurin family copper-binding protein [Actinomycetota bacterium]|nr:plastocyanin/azurin family copper-binding protein [Actinomycetota bacterium]